MTSVDSDTAVVVLDLVFSTFDSLPASQSNLVVGDVYSWLFCDGCTGLSSLSVDTCTIFLQCRRLRMQF